MIVRMKMTGRAVSFNSKWLQEISEMGYPLSLNRDVDGEPLCLAIMSGLMAVLQGLNRGEGSVNSSSDINGAGSRVPNCKHGI